MPWLPTLVRKEPVAEWKKRTEYRAEKTIVQIDVKRRKRVRSRTPRERKLWWAL